MKVGSLVTLNFEPSKNEIQEALQIGLKVPEYGVIYTVTAMVECAIRKTMAIQLAELMYGPNGSLWLWWAKHFREVQPPMSIADIFENELTEVL